MPIKKPSTELAHEVIDSLPPDATLADIEREIFVARMVELGLKDVEEGRVLTNQEMLNRIKSWQFKGESKPFVGVLISLLNDLPEDATMQEVMGEIGFAQSIQKGIQQGRVGQTTPHEEVQKHVESW